jgi:serine phosphatase RsbU (regulator of sigma subunit)/CheY-like chemotaxis protein
MPANKACRLAIASDQAIYLRGLASLAMSLPGIQLVGEAHSGQEALQLCQLTRPELILLDFDCSLEETRAIAASIRQHQPGIKIVLLLNPQAESQNQEYPDHVGCYTFSRNVSEDEFKTALTQVQRDPAVQTDLRNHPQAAFHHRSEEEVGEEGSELPGLGLTSAQRQSETVNRELVMAGRIQVDILPEEVPVIPGWDVAARLEPARETSGDFYDFIPLSNNKWGLVIADVSDKGIGAALFMALSSTLIRTYATRYPTLPGVAMSSVSERILNDTRGSMFVTAFYSVLEPQTGRLIYANGGHPPGYIISPGKSKDPIQRLRPTGMALGVSEGAQWKQKIEKLMPGDILILYTDGITEAQNQHGQFFGEDQLLDVVLENMNASAGQILESLLAEVHRFVGSEPRQDDIALVVIRRGQG